MLSSKVLITDILALIPPISSPYQYLLKPGVGVAQLFNARPSELEVPGSIFGDSIVCFDFLLICVALVLNARKTEY